MDALGLQPGQPCGWVSATRETLRKFLLQHFPTHRNPKATAAQQAAARQAEALAGGPQPAKPAAAAASQAGAPAAAQGVVVPECMRMRARLIARAESLQLPPHFLDGTRVPSPHACVRLS